MTYRPHALAATALLASLLALPACSNDTASENRGQSQSDAADVEAATDAPGESEDGRATADGSSERDTRDDDRDASDPSDDTDGAPDDTDPADGGEPSDATGEDTGDPADDTGGEDDASGNDDAGGCTDPGCPCDYDGESDGVCGTATTDSDGNCQKPGGYEADEATCDGLDNDCDGDVDEGCDDDGDDYCDADLTVVGTPSVCPMGDGDCNDEEASVHPGASEICDDGLDNDCDGDVDCDDDDCRGEPACTTGTETQCGDGVDNDGDGCTDCNDPDCAGNPCGPDQVCCTGMPSPGQCINGHCVDEGQTCPQ